MKIIRIAVLTCFAASASAWAEDDIPALWKAKCESCHGADGKAQTKQGKKHKVDDMTNEKWQANWTDDKIKKIIREGSKDKKEMKAFPADKVSDSELDGLVKHIRSFKG
ncbi:MAG: c-type cytochrome [Myxococcaceae bacterium]|nr:c-type cytochrome [Myxococcaceae bacterium]